MTVFTKASARSLLCGLYARRGERDQAELVGVKQSGRRRVLGAVLDVRTIAGPPPKSCCSARSHDSTVAARHAIVSDDEHLGDSLKDDRDL